MTEESYYQELITWIAKNKPSKEKLAIHKINLCKQHGQKKIPTDIEVLMHVPKEQFTKIRPYLQTKPVRTGSGVAVIATMTKPFPCPHGTCIFCPGGPESSFGDTPKSYTGKEPSTMRGERHQYDPYRIIFNRLEQYIVLGQDPQKVDQVIMGGTFPSFPEDYQEEYIRLSFKAYNDFGEEFFKKGELDLEKFKTFFELPGQVGDETRAEHIKEKVLALKEKNPLSYQEEQERNETANIRCIGITVETKPDYGRLTHGKKLLDYGVTRIELGVQTTKNELLEISHRGHSSRETEASIAELRDLGYKLNFHIMPGLPGKDLRRISLEEDKENLRELFDNSSYRPDMLKIYPCMVMPGTALYKAYEEGLFTPITTEEAAELLVNMKEQVPEYCRIMRVQRDIPTPQTTAGVDKTNLRQIIHEKLRERNIQCRCIRCREVGLMPSNKEVQLITRAYEASSGMEYFISAEAEDKVYGFIRLRFPSTARHEVITKDSALIRELHVYGKAIPIGTDDKKRTQHKGIGSALLAKAERIAIRAGKNKMVIISGVGVRQYYEKQGYKKEAPYVTKTLKISKEEE